MRIVSASIAIGMLVLATVIFGVVIVSSGSLIQTNDVLVRLEKLWNYHTGEGNDVFKAGWVQDVNGDNVSDIIVCTGGEPSLFCLDGLDGRQIWNDSDVKSIIYFKVISAEDNIHHYVLGASYKEIFLLNPNDGSMVWNISSQIDLHAQPARAVPDTTGDGVAEVLFAELKDGFQNIVLLNGINGKMLWKSSYNGTLSGICEIPDLNKAPIIVYSVKINATLTYIVSLNPNNGTEIWRHSSSPPTGYGSVIICTPVVSGNSSDLIINLGDGILLLEGDDGEEVWRHNFTFYLWTPSVTVWDIGVISDLNGDDVNDVIEGGWDEYARALSGTDGSIIWETNLGRYSTEVISTINDLNQDGLPEVLCGTGQGFGYIHILSGRDGYKLASYLLSSAVQSDVWDVNSVPDLNGDGFEDIVVGSWDDNAYLLTPVVQRDQIPPQINLILPQNGSTINSIGPAEVIINVTFQDNIAVNASSLIIEMDGKVISEGNESTLGYDVYTLKVGPGSHTVESSVSDYSGNAANSTILFSVVDYSSYLLVVVVISIIIVLGIIFWKRKSRIKY